MAPRRPLHAALYGLTALGALGAVAVALSLSSGADAPLWRLLGMGTVPYTAIPGAATVVIGPGDGAVGPPVTALSAGGRVTFVNATGAALRIKSTTLAPRAFSLLLEAHGHATVTLERSGLYHYYDATSALPASSRSTEANEYYRALSYTSPDDLIVPLRRHRFAREGWIAVLSAVPGLEEDLLIPNGHPVFTPRVIIAVAGSAINVVSRDTRPHNFVVDSASPMGSAFMIDSVSSAAAAREVRRVLVLQQPGLYHVYCTLHAQVVGVVGGWHRVRVRPLAMSWSDDPNQPMDAWILVLPATTTG